MNLMVKRFTYIIIYITFVTLKITSNKIKSVFILSIIHPYKSQFESYFLSTYSLLYLLLHRPSTCVHARVRHSWKAYHWVLGLELSTSCLLGWCSKFESHLQPFFPLVILKIGYCFLPGWLGHDFPIYSMLPTTPRMTVQCHHTQISSVEMRFPDFAVQSAWNKDPSYCLPSSYDYRHEPSVHSLYSALIVGLYQY